MAEPVKIKFSTSYSAKMARIRRLPKLVRDSADTILKKDAIGIIKEFKEGIIKNNFGLMPLSEVTVKRKVEIGLPRPRAPLYGYGETRKNSLINALGIRKVKNGYRIYRRWAKHHTADLSLRVLLSIHEHGAIIGVTEKMRAYLHYIGIHLRKETKIIRIPPRPVVDKAIQRHFKKKLREEGVKEVRSAIRELIKTGRESGFKKMQKYDQRIYKEAIRK